MKLRNVLRLWEDKVNWLDELALRYFNITTPHLRHLTRSGKTKALARRLKPLTPGPKPETGEINVKRYVWSKFREYRQGKELRKSYEQAILEFLDWLFDESN